MNALLLTLLIFASVGLGVWLASLGIEALRSTPDPPKKLRWAPDITIAYVDVGGHKLRFIRSGRGPILVLLHTLRTQLDLFEKVVPGLSKHFTVYALDYPGHGAIPTFERFAMTPLSSSKRSKASSKNRTCGMSLSLAFLLAGRSRSSLPPSRTRGLRASSP